MVPVAPDFICPRFDRVPESLIEEPEECQFCVWYEEGLCHNENSKKG